MKKVMMKTISVYAILGIGVIQVAMAGQAENAEQIFNGAEIKFNQYFSPKQATQTWAAPEWPFFRGPYNDGVYAGINKDGSVYVVGGTFGNNPSSVGTVDKVKTLFPSENGGEDSSGGFCDISDVPDYYDYRREGNVIDISTKGCPKLPADTPKACSASDSLSETENEITGISMLLESNVLTSELNGIENFSVPTSDVSSKVCQINAPKGIETVTVNSDICFDITDQYSNVPSIEITPPVTTRTKSTMKLTIVSKQSETIVNFIDRKSVV